MIPRMAVEWERVREVFHAALDLPKGEVPEYVDTACAGDPDLRQQVESLLGELAGRRTSRPSIHVVQNWFEELRTLK